LFPQPQRDHFAALNASSTFTFSDLPYFLVSDRSRGVNFVMPIWCWYAVAAAILYHAHQIFIQFPPDHVRDSLGALLVEDSAGLFFLRR
jgi:hypothetical protein